MSVYIYTATDTEGKKKEGMVDARSYETAVNLLKSQGLFVIALNEHTEGMLAQLLKFGGVKKQDVVAFTRQFSTMMSSGLPVSRALDVLVQQASKNFKKILLEILRDVEGGTSLSEAMGRHPDVFSTTYRALVRAGESSGKLDTILIRLADTMEAERELSGKLKAALVYPAVVFVAMVAVFFILMIFVIPKLSDMYTSLNVDLPASTVFLITSSGWIVDNVILVFIALAASVLGLRAFLKTQQGRHIVSEIMFKAPVFGRINRQKENAQFTRTLSLLIASAIPIVEALQITSEVLVNQRYKDATLKAAEEVKKGRSLSEFVKENPVFPPLIANMISVGEETGKIDEMLEKVAHYFDGEVDHLVKGLSGALEPVILILLGGMVGMLIVSIITPIYKITSAL